jgi:hypothetical protein
MNLTCLFWHGKFQQWHQCLKHVTTYSLNILHVAKDDIHFVINCANLFPSIICLLIVSRSKEVCFVQTIHEPHDEKCQHLIMMQKTLQKNMLNELLVSFNFDGLLYQTLVGNGIQILW